MNWFLGEDLRRTKGLPKHFFNLCQRSLLNISLSKPQLSHHLWQDWMATFDVTSLCQTNVVEHSNEDEEDECEIYNFNFMDQFYNNVFLIILLYFQTVFENIDGMLLFSA